MSNAILQIVVNFCPVLITVTLCGLLIGIVMGAFYGR